MKRFLVGQATADERMVVEQRFIDEPAFFEALCALEHEMLLALVREELPARWAQPLRRVLEASSDRHRHLEEMQRLVSDMGRISAAAPPAARVAPGAWWLRAAAVVVVGIGLGAWWWGTRSALDPSIANQPPAGRPSEELIATFLLVAGPTRSPDAEDNVVRIPPSAARARFAAVIEASSAITVEARIRTIGGAPLDLPTDTTVRETTQGLEVAWVAPVAALVPGDYLISYNVRSSSGESNTIASRFVRIVK